MEADICSESFDFCIGSSKGDCSEQDVSARNLFFIRMPAGQEKYVTIGDLEGWGYANSDIRAYMAALSVVQV